MATTTSTTAANYLAAVNRPGAFQSVLWTSEVKPAAAHKGVRLVKTCTAVIRTGVQYANLSENADRETGALPWGEWAVYPYIVTHKGAEYVRLYTLDGTVRASYTVDGVEVDRDAFLSYLTPSARESRRSVGGTITVKIANVTLL